MTKTISKLLDERELKALEKRYGEFPLLRSRVRMAPESLEIYRNQLKRRRGEILLVLAQPAGDILLHTKHFYPPGIYRLPTGGINWEEPVIDAWHRELMEETQFSAKGERLLGVIEYEFFGAGPSVPFVSYVFHLGGVTDIPDPLDESEGISHFRWIPRTELSDVTAALTALDQINAEKGDWGRFRAVAHEFVQGAKW